MIRIHCQGCGRTSPVDDSAIGAVRYERRGYQGRRYDADLCPRCETQLLARFFGVTPGGRTEQAAELDALLGPPTMPTFLEEAAP